MINTIFNEDNKVTMQRMPDKYLNGIITSPPYNINTGRHDNYYNNGYMNIDNLSEPDYIDLRLKEFKEFERILQDRGCVLYNISYHNVNPILPLLLVTEVHKQTNLTMVDIISWKKTFSMPFQSCSNRLSRIVEQIYVFVKKEHTHDFIANKEISKINEKTKQKFYKHYVNLIEAKNNDGIKCNLKASFSTELVSKLINIYFPENSLIYDPFMGIGSTAMACKLNKLNYIGSELNNEFYEIAISRLK